MEDYVGHEMRPIIGRPCAKESFANSFLHILFRLNLYFSVYVNEADEYEKSIAVKVKLLKLSTMHLMLAVFCFQWIFLKDYISLA